VNKPHARLLITIDTEPDCDTRWNRSNPLTFTSVTEGIPKLLRPLWDKYGINPLYFVSPEVLADDACCEVLKHEMRSGAVIGAHLHSEYVEPSSHVAVGKPSLEFPCFAHSTEVEFEKIKNLTQLIERKLGFRPEWYRAARFGADIDTIRSLKTLGYKYDSSVTPHINWSKLGGPDHSRAPEQPYWIAMDDYYKPVGERESIGIMEFPVTISGKRWAGIGQLLNDRWFFYNWLRPTHMTVMEQRKLVNGFLRKYKDPTFVMMFHSMEIMIGKSPYVRNRWMQKLFLARIEKVIRYIQNIDTRHCH
jgi:hypothetical protein